MKIQKIMLNSLMIVILCSACGIKSEGNTDVSVISQDISDDPADLDSGTQTTEGNDPDYDIVFPQDEVNQITITISPEDWELMMEDMTELYGPQGSGQRAGPAGRPEAPPMQQDPKRDGMAPPPGGMPDGRPGEGIVGSLSDENPIWVEATISFEGESWEHVGVRYKGNSSLRSTWGLGSLKLPFKLDFDQFEDDYPDTEDQRFFGFKQLSFSSNFHDDSLLREKVAADLFRDFGVPSAQTAFYAVSIDYGEGLIYLGLYTAVEVVDDTLIETQFSDDSGNVYKPEGAGATFASGSFSEASFDKETNQGEDDYSDILALYAALHTESRTTNPEEWRKNLEEVLDVDTYLRWLAANTVIENWDTYGVMSHNYYLYHDPETDQLVWIPWDNNESLKTGSGTRRGALDLDLAGIGDEWPLISYLRDDPVYFERYLGYIDSFLEEVLVLEELAENFQSYHDWIESYVLAEGKDTTLITSQAAFENSVGSLLEHIKARITAAEHYLDSLQ